MLFITSEHWHCLTTISLLLIFPTSNPILAKIHWLMWLCGWYDFNNQPITTDIGFVYMSTLNDIDIYIDFSLAFDVWLFPWDCVILLFPVFALGLGMTGCSPFQGTWLVVLTVHPSGYHVIWPYSICIISLLILGLTTYHTLVQNSITLIHIYMYIPIIKWMDEKTRLKYSSTIHPPMTIYKMSNIHKNSISS